MTKTDGFVSIPNWLYDDSDLTLHEFMVYGVLLRFRDHKTGQCFPGMTTIADRARISHKSVQRAIASLEQRGMIRVERRSTVRVNKPNVYHVALATETPAFIWADSARGKRVPKRPRPTDSESVVAEVDPVPTDSQSVPTDSQSLPPRTPSPPNKIHENKIQGQTLRSAQPSGHEMNDRFTFEAPTQATAKQQTYLHDLHIHLTGSIPNARSKTKWASLTLHEAQQLIGQYLRLIPRYDAYEGPEYGTPAYEALTPIGQKWADTGLIPDILEVA